VGASEAVALVLAWALDPASVLVSVSVWASEGVAQASESVMELVSESASGTAARVLVPLHRTAA
jgi:hypothetical protein